MNLRRLVLCLVSAVVVLSGSCMLPPSATGAAPEGSGLDYGTAIVEAKRFAAENSWALARDAYARAQKIAPDAEARRWSEFWQFDATWRAEDLPGNWSLRQRQIERTKSGFATLLKNAPDALWSATMQSRLAFYVRARQIDEANADRLAVADRLGAKLPDPDTTSAYLDFLKNNSAHLRPNSSRFDENDRRLLAHFDNACRLAFRPEDRGRFALLAAQFTDSKSAVPVDERARRWATAVVAYRGAPLETFVRAEQFLFLARTGFAPTEPRDTPADLPARLKELRALRTALAPDAKNDEWKKTDADLRRLEEWWSVPQLLVDAPIVIQPGTPLRIGYGDTGHTRVVVTLYRHTLENWVSRGDDDRVLQRAGIRSDSKIAANNLALLRRPGTDEIRRLTFAFDDVARLGWQRGEWEISSAAEPGFYTVLIQGEGRTPNDTRTLDVIVSSVKAAATLSPNRSGLLHVFRTSDGRPAAGISLRGVLKESDSTLSSLNTALDSGSNVALAPLKAGERQGSVGARLTAFAGDQPLDLPLYSWPAQNSPLIADVVVDRPLYRPGETVFWKLIVRERSEGRFIKPRQDPRISIALGNDQKLLDDVSVPLNDFGTGHGSFVIPITARPGAATLEIKSAADPESRHAIFYSLFRVDNFVPPAITAQIELASPPSSLRPGREIVVRVRGQYFSGGPVVGAAVLGQFRAESFYRPFNEGTQENPELKSWIESLGKAPLSALTAPDGTAEFRLLLPAFLPERMALHVDVGIQPDGGAAVQTSARWQINRTGVQVTLDGESNPVPIRPGEPFTFSARVADGRNEPMAFKGTAQFVEKFWSEAWLSPDGRIVSGDEMNATLSAFDDDERSVKQAEWRRLHAGYGTRVVEKKSVSANADGKIGVVFAPPHAGLFQLQFDDGQVVLPAAANAVSPDFSLVAADAATRSLPLPPGTVRLFSPANVSATQPLRFLAVAPANTHAGWFTLSGENEFISRQVDLRGGVAWIAVDTPPKFAGGGSAELLALDSPATTGSARVNFSIDDDSSHLAVSLHPANPENKPGTETSVDLSVVAPDAKPVAAEIVLVASDDALFALADTDRAPPEFWRYQSVVPAMTFTTPPLSKRSLKRFDDPRPGARLNPAVPLDEELLTLSPFEVSTGENVGYMDVSALAGSRSRSDAELSATLLGPSPDGVLNENSITIRRHFSFTASWQPEILTGANGTARVNMRYPDNLTRWRFAAYAVGADGNTFGRAQAFTTTSLPFQARLQLPRALVVGDTAAPSALFLNRTDRDVAVSAALHVEGAAEFAAGEKSGRENLAIAKQSEARMAWTFQAARVGAAKFTLAAKAGENSDGMEASIPVFEDGLQQETAASGRLARSESERSLTLTVPTPLDPARTQVQLEISPSSAATILDALPYLVDYPYGCVEQTMNRFMPAIVARKTLLDLGFDAAAVERRMLARQIKSIGKPGAGLGALDEVVQQSLARLAQAQQPSGTFGWWPGQQQADVWMTGYIAWGLALAHEAGMAVPASLAGETVRGLSRLLSDSTEASDQLAWALAALMRIQDEKPEPSAREVFKRLYAARDRLGASGRACLLLAAHSLGQRDERTVLLRNLENGAHRVKTTDLGDTVSWGASSDYWRAMDSAVETTSLVLLALLETDPHHPLIEPAMNWLTLNRRSAHWNNSRDTAFAVLALTRFMALRQEATPKAEIEILANGRSVQRVKLSRDTLLQPAIAVTIPSAQLHAGENRLTVRRLTGESTVYAGALASSWARSDAVKPAGHLAEVSRDFVRQQSELTLMGTLLVTPEVLAEQGVVQAGEQVNARVTLTVPNELEYLMVEVPKPAGCEPLNPLSGWDARLSSAGDKKIPASPPTDTEDRADRGRALYREEHDDRSVFFIDHVPAGTWEIRFGLRAITLGDFRALPVKASAMYVPEVRANSDARRLRIESAR